ncbi:hypothetical protein GCM10007415_05040 [Parapedobacter pyrenivorans]|uniref:DUF5007 domain-containing protein n=2 Tax=Parapedobacter pyrenivorans TaxID=1305674 RepID=A0A917M372_9SPHI|nr:hypothetical protein GCM10007415_05040 [Parapedobacter pyrenivorans]
MMIYSYCKMKVKTLFKFLAIIAVIAFSLSCSKIEQGFLSDTIRYRDNVIFAKRGMTLTLSDRINADGSTPPFTFKMLNLRHKATGEPAPSEFFTEYDVEVFKDGMTFNAATDTTVELLNAKRELKQVTPMEFNEVSGQISFNRASANLPLGEYIFDLEASNRWGTKFYESFAEIHVVDPTNDELYEVTTLQNNASTSAEVFTGLSAPRFSVTKISNDGARVILKIVDRNGDAFNPAEGEIIKRGDRPMFETYAKFNEVIVTDTALICDFEVAPFPLAAYNDGVTDWGWLHYYRIPSQYVIIEGQPNSAANPAFSYQIKMEGTYVVEVKMMETTRIAGGAPPMDN